jgi:hypothetical protein
VQCTCGISWERDLLIDPAAVGANAARSQFRLRYGTREVDGAMRRETTSGGTTRRNINAPFSDGATGTSVEASVMDVEKAVASFVGTDYRECINMSAGLYAVQSMVVMWCVVLELPAHLQ